MTTRKEEFDAETRRLIYERKAIIRAIWEEFANSLPPDAAGTRCSIPDRLPLEDLFSIFESLEWEQISFDVEIHCVPTHPPSITPIDGCTCAICRRSGIVAFGWSL